MAPFVGQPVTTVDLNGVAISAVAAPANASNLPGTTGILPFVLYLPTGSAFAPVTSGAQEPSPAPNTLPAGLYLLDPYQASAWTRQRVVTAVVGETGYRVHTVSATAAGNTALWTPQAGKKFRLMRYFLTITSNASLAAGAVEVIGFQDATTDMALTHSVFVPTTAVTTAAPPLFYTGWIDLGNGLLSATANNVLNVNLGTALATGVCRVTCIGQEE